MESDKINKEYWANIEPEEALSGLGLPGTELTQHLKTGSTVLDVGCGPGKVSEYLFNNGYVVVGIDINEKMLRANHERNAQIKYVKADITEKLPFPDNTFDAVVVA